MREIKFRVWDSYKEKMRIPTKLIFDECEELHVDFDESGVGLCNPIIMQYTGIKDKNGKDIYEGDWVKLNNKYVHFVKWHDHKAAFFPFYIDESVSIEVIGNIYETPELLEEK